MKMKIVDDDDYKFKILFSLLHYSYNLIYILINT